MEAAEKSTSSYKQILKSTSIYGGVQVFSILAGIIRSKTIALWLGPVGMGVFAIFNSFLVLIGSIVNLGLSTSAVKNISLAHASNDHVKFSTTVNIFRKITIATGLLGFFSTILLSRYLSRLNFQTTDYTLSFVLLSVVVLLSQLQQGSFVILQATQRVKQLALASFWGMLIGLIVNLPLFYIWRERAIVPSLIVSAVISLAGMFYFSKSVHVEKMKVSLQQVKDEGYSMIKMGITISLTGIITQFSSYGIRLFISNAGNLTDLGLYSSGFALVSTYFGMVFTAMGTDYYPRLSKVIENEEATFNEMNKQAEVAILILAPLLCVFLIFINWVVTILLSRQFLPIIPMVKWAVLGVFFQACSWSIAYIFAAKGHYRRFFVNEIITICYLFIINISCYYWLGLVGLGVGFLLQYFVYTVHMIIVGKSGYGFRFSKSTLKILLIQLLLIVVCFGVSFLPKLYMFSAGSVIILLSFLFSFKKLNEAIGIADIIKARLKRK